MDIRQRLFKYRSYTPFPFLVLMIIFAHPTTISLIIGLCIVLIGECLRFWGVAIAGSETRTTGHVGGTFLITRGPFSYVRNPLYLGNIMIYFGIGIMSFALFPWLILAALVYFFVQYYLIVSLEEEHLLQKFGDEFQQYCKAVPKFFPSFRKYISANNSQPELEWKRGLLSEKRSLQAITILILLLVVIWQVRG
jgi:protein-S-isoprenylcysteine O-methyltransferase Ste14